MKLKWKVGEVPAGPFRSFQKRDWPTAYHEDGRPAVYIICEDGYEAALARGGRHAKLIVEVAQHHKTEAERARRGGFTWRRMAKRFDTLDQAKLEALMFLTAHPEFYS